MRVSRPLPHAILLRSLLLSTLPLSAVQAATPPDPLVLIHGLQGSAETWEDFGEALSIQGWIDGGCPRVVAGEVVNDEEFCPGRALTGGGLANRVFYRLTFSSSSNLTLLQQAQELSQIVSRVLLLNPGKSRVNLVGHSMGGLAARSYVQQISGGASSVRHVVTVGTPHLGAHLAPICMAYPFLPGCPPTGSIALAELDPEGVVILTLNDFSIHPLPSSVIFTSIVVGGKPVLLSDDVGDGVVSEASQNLTPLSTNPAVRVRSAGILLSGTDICLASLNLEHHSCEPERVDVQGEILRTLSIITLDNLEIGAFDNWSATVTEGSISVTLHQGPPGSPAKDIWTTSVFAFDHDGGGPGGGLDNDRLLVGGWGDEYRSLIQFDLGGLPSHATSAVLRLFCYTTWGDGTQAFWVDRVLESWDWRLEGSGSDRLRLWWADRPATTPWSATPLPAPVVGEWYEIDITDLYNGWMDGTYPVFGVQLRPTYTWHRWNYFYSSDNDLGPQFSPHLVIVP